MTLLLAFYVCLVLGLTLAELKEKHLLQAVFKPAAALGFIGIAFLAGALDHQYGRIIFAGLIACAIGDVCLLSRQSPKPFIAGMAAFAVGHFAYLTAFVAHAPVVTSTAYVVSTGLVLFLGMGVHTWLKPHLPKHMRILVTVYMFIILLMVINALSLPLQPPLGFAMIGAVLFAVSDVFVARDRFVSPDPRNALLITPLYFGAQALIALSAQPII